MKTNNKFSIRKYSVGVISVIIGLFILAGANSDDRVYANNESVPPIVSGVPEGGNPDGVDKVVDKNNTVVDKGDLSRVPTPVTPGYFALEKEAPKVAATPDEVEKEVDIDLVELGKIKYRDVKTKEIVAEKIYENDNNDPTRAGLTTLPDLPKGYRFVNKGLDRVETREIVVQKFLEKPYVSEEVGIKIKLQEVDGKLAVDPNINIEADKFAPGHNLVFDVEKYINDVEKATKQVVEFVGAEGKEPKTNIQDGYKFLGEYNDETKETTWKEKSHAYSSVDVPVVEKYFADKKQAGGKEVTPEKPEVTDTVTYKHLGKIVPVDEKGNLIEKAPTPDYLNDLKDPTKAMETPVPELAGYEASVSSILPEDPGVDTKVVYKEKLTDVEVKTKQVVEFVGAEGKAPKTNIQDDYKFKGKKNEVTKETKWAEKTHIYNSVDVPVVEKYFADKKQAGGKEVTPEKPEVTDTVTYKHLGKIVPVDEKGNLIEKAPTPDYLNDLKDPTKAMETPVPELAGYEATVKSVVPKELDVDTKVVYKEKLTDIEKATKQVVEFVGAEGKASKTNIQDDYKFKGKKNEVTKETTWKEKTHIYNSVDVPVVEKYFADKKQAGGKEVTPEKPEVTDTVTYKHLGKIVPVDEKGNLIEKAPTPDYLNDLKDPTKAMETPVPELKGYTPTVKSVVPKDLAKDTKVVYKKVEKPKVPEKPKETPKIPETPKETPKTPEIPKEKPKTPEVPKETPKKPNVPKIEQPRVPEVPKKEVSEKPKVPEVHKGEIKPTPEVHKKENSKLPNTGITQTETTILGMLMLLLTGFVARLTRTKKD